MLQFIFLILLAITTTSSSAELCDIKDKDSSKCLAASLQDVMPTLVQGFSNMNVSSMDPLHMELLDLSDKPGKLLNVRHKFHKVDMAELGSAVIKNVRTNLKKTEIIIKAFIKKTVIITRLYESQGKILTLPIQGDGPFNITLMGVKASLKMKGQQKNKNGKTHLKMDVVKFPFEADQMIVDFKNLLKANQQISEMINDVLNQNCPAVLDDMKESFGDGIGAAFQEVANRIFEKMPLDELIKI